VAPLRRSRGGSFTAILRWLQYADHPLAPLRRSRNGSIGAISDKCRLMKFTLIFALCCLITGCQTVATFTSVLGGSAACRATERTQSFPLDASFADISMAFKLLDGEVELEFAETWRCEYVGSFCGGGSWFRVWHGQDTKKTYQLSLTEPRQVIVYPHGSCLYVRDYLNACAAGTCDPKEYFGVTFVTDYTKPMHESRKLTSIEGLTDFGVRVHDPEITIEIVEVSSDAN
jgi:hypothetical protein